MSNNKYGLEEETALICLDNQNNSVIMFRGYL